MFYEFGNAAREAELRGFFGALIHKRNFQTFVQESVFAKTCGQRVVTISRFFEDGRVGVESYFGASFAGLASLLQLGSGLAFFVRLLPNRAVPLNFQFQPIRKRVHYRNADPVQTAGNFVSVAIEFSAS